MDEGRRDFLKAAGLAALSVAGSGLFELVSGDALAAEADEAGTRWAVVIDPRRCLKAEGCTDCIRACDSAHNVPVIGDPRHEVKWVWKLSFQDAFPEQEAELIDETLTSRSVLVFCNHCDNPPCVRVCPTQATFRREDGVVMMDWHRCIGCRYCMAACPYESRSFNWVDPRPFIEHITADYPTRTKGVVEKCTLCDERLAKHEPPACVAACTEKAMTFGNLADPSSNVRGLLRSRYALRRKAGLGTRPQIYYLV
jgi:Fe-S-cluster-containing dehydrogenase component